MNKTDLIAAVAEKAGLAKTDAKKALEAFVSTVSEELAKGEKIALIGFGTFSVARKVQGPVSIPLLSKRLPFRQRKSLNSKPVQKWPKK